MWILKEKYNQIVESFLVFGSSRSVIANNTKYSCAFVAFNSVHPLAFSSLCLCITLAIYSDEKNETLGVLTS